MLQSISQSLQYAKKDYKDLENKLYMNQTSTYTLTIPSSQGRLFKSLAKEMGWIIQKPNTKNVACGMDKAMEDVRQGRVTTYASVDDFFKKMEI